MPARLTLLKRTSRKNILLKTRANYKSPQRTATPSPAFSVYKYLLFLAAILPDYLIYVSRSGRLCRAGSVARLGKDAICELFNPCVRAGVINSVAAHEARELSFVSPGFGTALGHTTLSLEAKSMAPVQATWNKGNIRQHKAGAFFRPKIFAVGTAVTG